MKSPSKAKRKAEVLPEYDFSAGVRGKYAANYANGTNIVVLDPDIAEVFPDSKSVNEALRVLVKASLRTRRAAGR